MSLLLLGRLDHYLSLIRLGDALRKRKQLEDAYAIYLRAQKNSPRYQEGYDGLAAVCRLMGKPDEAQSWPDRWKAVYATKRNVSGRP